MKLPTLFKALFKSMGAVNIDGHNMVGRSVTIEGNRVFVDGVQQDGTLVGPISISVTGDVQKLECPAGSIEVSGSCGSVSTMSGDVFCGDVNGNVSTTSGDVTCGKVGGKVETMSGDIARRAAL